MARKAVRRIKKKVRGRGLSLFLTLSLIVHSIAAVAAPALLNYYAVKSQKYQSVTFVDVLKKKGAQPNGQARDYAFAPGEAVTPDEAALSSEDRQDAPLKSGDDGVMVASMEKKFLSPGVAGPETNELEAGSLSDEKIGFKKGGLEDGAGEDGTVRSYDDGLHVQVLQSNEDGMGIKPVSSLSAVTGIGPQFYQASVLGIGGSKAAADNGKPGIKDSGNGADVHGVKEKEARNPEGKVAAAGISSGGNREGGYKKTVPMKMASQQLTDYPGKGGAGLEKKISPGAVKSGKDDEPRFARAALATIPETGIEIKSPSDGATIDAIESTEITVAGTVKGRVSNVTVYINGVPFQTHAENGFFKITVPVNAKQNLMFAEGFDIFGDRCVSENVNFRVTDLAPVDMAVFLDCGGAGKQLKFTYARRPHPLKGQDDKKRDHEINIDGGKYDEKLTVACGARGIYTIGIENISDGQGQAELHLCLFPRDPARKRVRRLGTIVLGGKAQIKKVIRVLLPEGVFWDDDSWFSGVIESTRETIKYRQPEGIAWKEEE